MPIRGSPNGARHTPPQPGRDRPEWVVAINRNARSQSIGTGGRNGPVRAHWHEMIANPTVADAILDRLVHNAHRLNLVGDSLRKGAAKRAGLDGNHPA